MMAKMAEFYAYMKRFKLDDKELKFYGVWIEKYSRYCRQSGKTGRQPCRH